MAKTERFELKISPEDKKAIQKAAKKFGVTMAVYMTIASLKMAKDG